MAAKSNTDKRINFVKLVIENQEKGAEYLESIAFSLRCCKSDSQRIEVLASMLFLSKRTIERDVYERNTDTQE